jgi:hypothetical protein
MNPFVEALNDELSLAPTFVPRPPWHPSCESARIPRLVSSIEAYAALVVELYAEPYSDEIVMYRYDLSTETLDKLHGLWRMRFEADPALASRWRVSRAEAIQRYHER